MDDTRYTGDEAGGLEAEIWDLPTRVFHWLVAGLVVLGWATAEGGGAVFVVHRFCGYALLAALLFRLVWGVAGSRHARFADFVRPWRAVRDYGAGLLRLAPQRFVGHNPLGGWMIVALLGVLFLIVASGLFAAHDELAGPLARDLPAGVAHAIAGVHEALFNVLMALAVVHVAGVLLDSVLNGENLIRAMWTGRKRLDRRALQAEEPPVPALWALVVAAVAFAMVLLALA